MHKISLYYFIFSCAGFFLAYLYGRKTKRFSWKEYCAMIAAPSFSVIGMIWYLGFLPVYIFAIAALVGPILEWIIGFTYHKILGTRLWVYERYPLPGRYTSYLVMPIWGFGLLLFWLVVMDF